MDERDPEDLQSTPSALAVDETRLRTARAGSIQRGVLLVLAGHAVACSIAFAIGADNELGLLLWVLFLGVTQLAHVLPLAVWTIVKGQHRTTKGIWIAAGITALLNAACFGITISGV